MQNEQPKKPRHRYDTYVYPQTEAQEQAQVVVNAALQACNENVVSPQIRPVACCGVRELHGISGTSKEAIAEAIEEAKAFAGVLMATCNERMAKSAKHLLELGFKEVAACYNPNSTHDLRVFMLVLHEPRGAEVDDRYDQIYANGRPPAADCGGRPARVPRD